MPEEESGGPDGPEKPEPVKCPECGAEFKARDEVRKHIEEEHG